MTCQDPRGNLRALIVRVTAPPPRPARKISVRPSRFFRAASITPLLTIMPTATLPYTFAVDLRQPPLNWSGIHNFQIALELVTDTLHNGYSSAYELDWIAIQAPPLASFTASPTIGPAQLTVVFTIPRLGILSLTGGTLGMA